MNSISLEQINRFIDEFHAIYKLDSYISKKVIDHFYDKYTYLINISNEININDETKNKYFKLIVNQGYQIINQKNKKYVKQNLETEKEYFDNMFQDIDTNIKLDEEQRRAILIDEDYSLIIAGAGSGKTTTMAAKVKYLIDKKNVNPNNIMVLSFTNSSVEDLKELLNNKFKLGVEVLTFHKLGMKLLRGTENIKYDIIAEAGIYKIIEEYFLEVVFKNKELLKEYKEVFSEYLYLDEECLNYNSYNEYYKYYMDKKYNKCKDNIKQEIKKRKNNRSIYLMTINGEKVKSQGEVKIANYLFERNINYKYEEIYPYTLKDNRTYKPDFTIDNNNQKTYIEYFGLATLKKDGNYESVSEKYKEEISLKKETHNNNHTDLIELYREYESGDYFIKVLSEEIDKRNIEKNKKTDKEIFYRLLETAKASSYKNLISVIMTFINIFKENGHKTEDFLKLEQNCNDEKLLKQLKYIKEIFKYYENKIHSQNKIDFNDMINHAYQNVEIFKEEKKWINYKYVIIDEYQDISLQKHNLTKKISDLFQSKIVAVGDDWQTIFSFSGSDIELFLKFEENMGYCEEIKITNTYRNSQELIDVAGEFIQKNKKQIPKVLHSNKRLYKPIKLVEYEYDETDENMKNFSKKLEELIIEIYNHHPDDNILLLSRFNGELEKLLLSKLFYKDKINDKKIKCKAVPKANIDILTVHKSKGLGYDRVIILNGVNAKHGFPSQIKDKEIIKYLKEEIAKENNNNINESYDIDNFEYLEERRLFYVAMTRTRNELYIMTPSTYKIRSKFINEIENNKNVTLSN